ncbi:MAG: MSMEG_4193 family putative phosphomutase [Candidatus Nanopelagicaceae bacterium]|nr:MSMEG_4193 family putative phosphomutase [Candidatus Nanopelagicaceae bacterium]
MTLVILIRHAHSTANGSGILAGRTGGVHLSPLGRVQARKLASRLGEVHLKSLRSSPLERCAETINPWLRKREQSDSNLIPPLTIDRDLAEVDYGLWSGMKLRTLSRDPLWKIVQERPSKVTFPGGESLLAMQRRAMKSVNAGLSQRGKGHVLLMSHGDVVKSIIASALGMHLDEFQRIVIDPASVSVLDYSGSKPRILLLNDSQSKLDSSIFAERGRKVLLGGGAGTPRKGSPRWQD